MIKDLKKSLGFTLTETLIAVFVIGIVSTLTIPKVLTNIQKDMFANQLKNMVGTIQQVAVNQMSLKSSKTLMDTVFNNPEDLLTSDYLNVVQKSSSKYTVKSIKGTNVSSDGLFFNTSTQVILNNGVLLNYRILSAAEQVVSNDDNKDYLYGEIFVDLNGNDKPNIVGRDIFKFKMTKKGKIVSAQTLDINTSTAEEKCKAGDADYCFYYLIENDWKMKY